MAEVFRTPDERFDGLPGYDFAPNWFEADGLRLHYVDDGSGDPVVCFHGEPTWAYLYRKMLPPLRDAGHRVICPDYAGFGRSDKPTDRSWYSYERHVELMRELVEGLDLRDATVVLHDWGGPIGLRLAVEHPDRIARMVILDTGLFTGRQRMSDAWFAFRDFVERTEDLPVAMLIRRACKTDPGDDVAAAYDAPFPEPRAKAGARAFPLMMPLKPEDPGGDAGQRVLEALAQDGRPMLFLWADSDPILTPEVGRRFAQRLGRDEPELIPEASHFLQEDQGDRVGRRIAEWLGSAAA